jgi:transposase
MEQRLDLPDDIESLRDMVIQLQGEIHRLKSQKDHLQEQVRLLLHKRFGAQSEKYPAAQSDLFNEAEVYAEDGSEPFAADDTVPLGAEATGSPAPSTKRGRKALPKVFPRVDIIHELPEPQRHCPEGHALVVIGEEVSEQLDIIPAKIQVLRHIRKKYACPCCGNGVKIAPLPPQPIPKSNASPALLAFIVISKFLDALPLYRQSKQFTRIGVNLPRATLAHWMIRCGLLIQPLINLLQDAIHRYPIQQMDETSVQVLKEPGKQAATKSYMWVQKGGPPEQPVVLFTYSPSRGQAVAEQLIQGYKGFLQTDGYEAYANVCAKHGLRQLGCWAHARRKFDEALKAQGKKPARQDTIAHQAMTTIRDLYRIEADIKDFPPEQKQRIRQDKAIPILKNMKIWLDHALCQVTPTSLTGEALAYLSKQWPVLTVYCEDGRLDIDNNSIERAIRPFVIGRNNWLFADTVKGAKASANLYSLIETARLNGLEPYRYLDRVFEELPKAQSLADIEQLLPWQVDKDSVNAGWTSKQAA